MAAVRSIVSNPFKQEQFKDENVLELISELGLEVKTQLF